jgi:hypothetical protein
MKVYYQELHENLHQSLNPSTIHTNCNNLPSMSKYNQPRHNQIYILQPKLQEIIKEKINQTQKTLILPNHKTNFASPSKSLAK